VPENDGRERSDEREVMQRERSGERSGLNWPLKFPSKVMVLELRNALQSRKPNLTNGVYTEVYKFSLILPCHKLIINWNSNSNRPILFSNSD